jgi:hypothetical protein
MDLGSGLQTDNLGGRSLFLSTISLEKKIKEEKHS